MTGEQSSIQGYFDESIDIHHVFPQRWCRDNSVDPAYCDSVINKSPLTARTNRRIGGSAPSEYLDLITSEGVPRDKLNDYLRSHLVSPEHLWADNFDEFFSARRSALLGTIRTAMGKQSWVDVVEEEEEPPAAYELVRQDSLQLEDIV